MQNSSDHRKSTIVLPSGLEESRPPRTTTSADWAGVQNVLHEKRVTNPAVVR